LCPETVIALVHYRDVQIREVRFDDEFATFASSEYAR
jgi:hypothetical protein